MATEPKPTGAEPKPAPAQSHPDQKPGESGIPTNTPPAEADKGGEPETAAEKEADK